MPGFEKNQGIDAFFSAGPAWRDTCRLRKGRRSSQGKMELRIIPNIHPAISCRIKFSNFIETPEYEFALFIKEIESDPLFRRLAYPEDPSERVVSIKRKSHFFLSKRFFSFNEQIASGRFDYGDNRQFDLESFIEKNRDAVELIKNIGYEKFHKYYITSELPENQIDFDMAKMQRLHNFLNEIAVHSGSRFPSLLVPAGFNAPHVSYQKIASIGEDGEISFFSPHLAKGGYMIDYEKIERIKGAGMLTAREIKKVKKLIKNLEIINYRKNILCRILENIVKKQSGYLRSGNTGDLVAFTQKDLSGISGFSRSNVSRSLHYRSVVLPWGEEKPVRALLPNNKEITRNLLENILCDYEAQTDKIKRTDSELCRILSERYGVSTSRRSVAEYRREAGIPSVYQRRRAGVCPPQKPRATQRNVT
ncbi:MAG: hypothetical protein ABIJ11_04880 [Elusimicrobiota bacterium]